VTPRLIFEIRWNLNICATTTHLSLDTGGYRLQGNAFYRHALDPIRLRDLTPAARREERRLRASELAARSGNLSNGSDRMSPTSLHPRLVGVLLGVSERIESTNTHTNQTVKKAIW